MLNILQFYFLLISIGVVFLGILVNCFSSYLPSYILKIFKYGKFAHQEEVPMTFQVPKRWFAHFYRFASLWSLLALYSMHSIYFNNGENVPAFLTTFLALFKTELNTVSASSSFLAMTLLSIQCFKRFYETHFVSVFSDAKMDINHYFIGFAHYFCAVLAIVCEAEGMIFSDRKYIPSYSYLGLRHYFFAGVFLWATHNQLLSARILGDLRRNKEGKVVTSKYKIPVGGYFELISNPHQFFEIVMYFCLWMILWSNRTWPYVMLWVVSNQVETALLSHWWYKENFKSYPTERKAVIPFIL